MERKCFVGVLIQWYLKSFPEFSVTQEPLQINKAH